MIANWWLFRAWLLCQPSGVEVGYTWFPDGSPIARWLEYETGKEYEIWQDNYNVLGADEMDDLPLPFWVHLYHPLVDGRKDRYGSPIYREHALRILEFVEYGMAQQMLKEK